MYKEACDIGKWRLPFNLNNDLVTFTGTRVSYPLDDVEVPNSPGSRGRIYSPLSSDLSEGGILPFEYGSPRTQRGGSRPVTR